MLKLLQGYYHFLSLGKFMEQVILTNDLSDLAMNLPIKTWSTSSFMLKESLIKNLLTSLHKHPDKRNIYGYLTEISAFKGIFSVMRELIENDATLRDYLKTLLQDQYFPFEQTIRFLRNVLNHTTTSGLNLKLEDYEIQRDFILSPKIQRTQKLQGSAEIKLDFVYAQYISQRKGNKEYWIHLQLDFANLTPGIGLENLISRHNLYLLAELCFNLSQLIEAQKKSITKKQESTPTPKEKSSSPTSNHQTSSNSSKKEKKSASSAESSHKKATITKHHPKKISSPKRKATS